MALKFSDHESRKTNNRAVLKSSICANRNSQIFRKKCCNKIRNEIFANIKLWSPANPWYTFANPWYAMHNILWSPANPWYTMRNTIFTDLYIRHLRVGVAKSRTVVPSGGLATHRHSFGVVKYSIGVYKINAQYASGMPSTQILSGQAQLKILQEILMGILPQCPLYGRSLVSSHVRVLKIGAQRFRKPSCMR